MQGLSRPLTPRSLGSSTGNASFFTRVCVQVREYNTIAFMIFVIVFSTFPFYSILLPRFFHYHGWWSIIISLLEGYLCVLSAVLFLATSLTNPGYHPKSDILEHNEVATFTDAPHFRELNLYGRTVASKWCTTCLIYRPPRVGHCRECNRCVEGFDHHCYFLRNCIGRRNYRLYYMFLLMSTIRFITEMLLTCYIVYIEGLKIIMCAMAVITLLAATCGISFTLSLLLFHTFLITVNETTSENAKDMFENGNPHDRGCLRNWVYAFHFGQPFLPYDYYAMKRIVEDEIKSKMGQGMVFHPEEPDDDTRNVKLPISVIPLSKNIGPIFDAKAPVSTAYQKKKTTTPATTEEPTAGTSRDDADDANGEAKSVDQEVANVDQTTAVAENNDQATAPMAQAENDDDQPAETVDSVTLTQNDEDPASVAAENVLNEPTDGIDNHADNGADNGTTNVNNSDDKPNDKTEGSTATR